MGRQRMSKLRNLLNRHAELSRALETLEQGDVCREMLDGTRPHWARDTVIVTRALANARSAVCDEIESHHKRLVRDERHRQKKRDG